MRYPAINISSLGSTLSVTKRAVLLLCSYHDMYNTGSIESKPSLDYNKYWIYQMILWLNARIYATNHNIFRVMTSLEIINHFWFVFIILWYMIFLKVVTSYVLWYLTVDKKLHEWAINSNHRIMCNYKTWNIRKTTSYESISRNF